MREIKFRAWDKFDRKIVSGDHIIGPRGDMTVALAAPLVYTLNGFFSGNLKERFDWMQYTSLKDKNGKEIYEGDLLWNGDVGAVWRVEWCEGGYWSLCDKEVCESKPINSLHLLEIIGNIYSNPDLIK